ncbi:tetratricopeptide repeat protein [Yoonia litorea]|uniref:Tetratricopeptide repeat-containing protein n=1 Tax=Yoonia litorea TaxID=1123755 RepID=A0A1I6N247_9RHOB|nr:tetratricopeptide repeat protein [Yoonia litorea]SFS21984.1 Tetratricopeptide repeat-containing protein [Yoonia litorea]
MRTTAFVVLTGLLLSACADSSRGNGTDGVFAPGVAGESDIDGLLVGHRLMAAGEYELALQAYNRAAVQQGINVDTLSAIGSANLSLGRLGQAERWLRRAVEEDPTFPPAWNNLGVVLMERGQVAEASQVFQRAFAADNGNSDEIRENLRLALAKLENTGNNEPQENQNFNLIRRGPGDFVLTSEPL